MSDKLKKHIGKQVKYFRNAKGITQSQLAEIIDKSDDTVSFLEMGRTLPSIANLDRIAKSLDVRLVDIIDDSEKEPNYFKTIRGVLKGLDKNQGEKIASIIRDMVGLITRN